MSQDQNTTTPPKTTNPNLVRADFTNVIFIGTQGIEDNKQLLAQLKESFPDKHVYVMDKEIYNSTCELFIKKHIKWREDIALREYISKPENIQALGLSLIKLKEALCTQFVTFNPTKDKFTLKNVVDATNMNHAQAQNMLDMLFAFSMLAIDNGMKPTHYQIIESEEQRIKYIDNIIAGFEKEKEELIKVREHLKGIVKNQKSAKRKATSKTKSIEKVEEAGETEKEPEKCFRPETASVEDCKSCYKDGKGCIHNKTEE